MCSDDVVLRATNLSKCFEMYDKPVHRLFQSLLAGKKKFFKEFWALKNISFDVYQGECIGVIGQNGAGKSTLLQLLVGTLQPTTGEVELKGRVAALLELGSGFNPDFTGRENVYMNAAILGLSKNEIDLKFSAITDFADIGDFIEQPVKTYSSGMMIRLAFAVQVMVEPDILIVDEALAVGDALFQRKCYARMETMIAKGMTLFLVTHDTETVKRMCKKALYLKRGEIAEFGDSVDVVSRYLKDLFPVKASEKIVSESHKDAHKSSCFKHYNSFQHTLGKSIISTNSKFKNFCYTWINDEHTPKQHTFGIGGGKILSMRIYGLIEPNILPRAGTIKIEVDAQWDYSILDGILKKENLPCNIYIGYGFANIQNIRFFGGNTCSAGIDINPLNVDHVTAVFEVELPTLVAGDYFIVLALSLGNLNMATHLNWNDCTARLISMNQVHGGFISPKTKINVI